MSASKKSLTLPPRWIMSTAWAVHRAVYRVTGGRRGLWLPGPNKFGTMRVTTVGRRTGKHRSVILGYLDDSPNLVTIAMNGWGEGEPAWWLNLLAHPEATVALVNGRREVSAAAAEGAERARLWALWREMGLDDFDEHAKQRLTETAVVVLSPRTN